MSVRLKGWNIFSVSRNKYPIWLCLVLVNVKLNVFNFIANRKIANRHGHQMIGPTNFLSSILNFDFFFWETLYWFSYSWNYKYYYIYNNKKKAFIFSPDWESLFYFLFFSLFYFFLLIDLFWCLFYQLCHVFLFFSFISCQKTLFTLSLSFNLNNIIHENKAHHN